MDELDRIEALIGLRRSAEAESRARAFLAAHPDDDRALRQLSLSLHHQDRNTEARAAAVAAVSAAPDEALNHVVCSDMHRVCGDRRLARQHAETAVTLAPHSWVGYFTRANLLRDGNGGERAQALQDAREAASLNPHSADVRNLLGLCHAALGQRDEERRAYEQALALDPHHALAMNNLGALDLNTGRLGSGGRHLASALQSNPHLEIMRRNYDAFLMGVLRRFWWLLAVVGVVEAVLLVDGASPAVRGVTGLVLVALGTWLVRHTVAEAPSSGSLVWRGLFRRQPWGGRFVLLYWSVTGVCVVALAVLPTSSAYGALALLVFIGRIMFIGWVANAVLSRFRRRGRAF